MACRKANFTEATTASETKSSTSELLLQLDLRLQNVPDFSSDQDMVEYTKLTNEIMEFDKAMVKNSFRYRKKLEKVEIPANASKRDLEIAYLEAGRKDEFEKKILIYDKQATLITSFMKRHPELRKLDKDKLAMIFLKIFSLNQIKASKKSISNYSKVQDTISDFDLWKCGQTWSNNTTLNETTTLSNIAYLTAAYAVAEAACILTGVGYPVCYAAATLTYSLGLLNINDNYIATTEALLRDYHICVAVNDSTIVWPRHL